MLSSLLVIVNGGTKAMKRTDARILSLIGVAIAAQLLLFRLLRRPG